MHRIEIEQIPDHDLRTHVAQCLRAFVVISHHRTHRFALLQQLFGDRPPYPTDASRRSCDQNWICHVAPLNSFGSAYCHHRVDHVEERSVLRRPTSETTNSLSVDLTLE